MSVREVLRTAGAAFAGRLAVLVRLNERKQDDLQRWAKDILEGAGASGGGVGTFFFYTEDRWEASQHSQSLKDHTPLGQNDFSRAD